VATALLSAGEARAVLVDGPVTCEGLGTGICLPTQKDLFDNLPLPYIVSDNDPLFNITADPTAIILNFPDPATGNDLDTVGFRLIGLESIPALVPGEIALADIDFSPNWMSLPTTLPFVTNVGGIQTIQWTVLTGADPQLGSIARINLSFVPEPSTAALTALGLIGLAARRRRP
jgi:hypothetical protein